MQSESDPCKAGICYRPRGLGSLLNRFLVTFWKQTLQGGGGSSASDAKPGKPGHESEVTHDGPESLHL